MPTYNLGGAAHSGSWSPRFGTSGLRTSGKARKGGSAPIMSLFPTIKGEPRMEGLRRYFHKDMALILDARPDVSAWTAATSSIIYGKVGRQADFLPEFRVEEAARTYSIRLLGPDVTRSEAAAERYRSVQEAYAELGESLVVITAAELATNPHLAPAQELFRNRGRDWPEELPAAVSEAWGDSCPTTLGDIHADMGGGIDTWMQLLSLASHGYVLLDLDHGVDGKTPVLACRRQGYRL